MPSLHNWLLALACAMGDVGHGLFALVPPSAVLEVLKARAGIGAAAA